jgi:hypothetical protein
MIAVTALEKKTYRLKINITEKSGASIAYITLRFPGMEI